MGTKGTETGLTVVQQDLLPSDEPTAAGASRALATYRDIQRVFDEQMPDAIMEIRGKKFRKKSYWRAIANAFGVLCELISVDRIDDANTGDWGYVAVVRATAPNGRTSDGDGACMASEKVDRDGNPTAMQTVHNVRSHAVTRAKNRAISDLVGFGEVSADELGPADWHDSPPAAKPKAAKEATQQQLRMLGAKASARADQLLEIADGEGILLPDYPTKTSLRDAIAKLAKERVGCGEVILGKEVDPLIIAIDGTIINLDGTLSVAEGGSA